MANVVEARLRGVWDDVVSASIQRTVATIDRGLQSIEDRGTRTLEALDRVANRVDASFSRAAGSLTPLSAALGAGAGAAIKFAGDMEAAQGAFASLMKSEADAAQFLKDLEAFSARTPFEFDDMKSNALILRNFKFETEEVIPVMLALGDALAGMPEQEQRIKRAALALGQMNIKGAARAEEMLQLVEAGIPAFNLLAQKIGVDVPTAMKMMEKGAVDGSDAVRWLVAGIENEFGGKMARVSETFIGQWSNMKDALAAFARDGGAVLLPYAKSAVASIIQLIGAARGWVQAFGALPEPVQKTLLVLGALVVAAPPALFAISGLVRVVGLLVAMGQPLAAFAGIVGNVAFAFANGLVPALVGAEAAVATLVPWMAALASVTLAVSRNWSEWQNSKAIDAAPADRLAAIQRLEQGLRDHGVSVDEVKAKYDAGAMSIEQYSAALRKLASANAPKPPESSIDRVLREMQERLATITKPPDNSKEIAKQVKHAETELNKLRDLQARILRGAIPEREQVMLRYAETIRDINAIDLAGVKDGEARKRVLRAQAALIRDRELRDLAEKELQTQRDLDRELSDMSASFAATQAAEAQRGLDEFLKANEVRMQSELRRLEAEKRAKAEALDQALRNAQVIEKTVSLSRAGTLSPEIGQRALEQAARLIPIIKAQLAELRSQPILNEQQVEDVLRLQAALERLNSLNMTPFMALLRQMRQNLNSMGEQLVNAWGRMWEDLVSGQENAGRRMLAAMIRIVADQIRLWSLQLVAMSITRAAMGDWGGAARAAAGAAGLAALSGVISGLAARLEKSDQQQQVTRPQAATEASRPQQAAPIVVGRPGGAQSAGGTVSGRIEVEVKPPAGWVAAEVKQAIKGNKDLRLVIAGATA